MMLGNAGAMMFIYTNVPSSVTRYWNKKEAKFFLRLPKKITAAVFTLTVMFSKYPKVPKYFGLISKGNLPPRT